MGDSTSAPSPWLRRLPALFREHYQGFRHVHDQEPRPVGRRPSQRDLGLVLDPCTSRAVDDRAELARLAAGGVVEGADEAGGQLDRLSQVSFLFRTDYCGCCSVTTFKSRI